MATRKSTVKKWVLIVLVIFILAAIIGGTYSRYSSTGTGTAELQVAKWAVKINTVDITSNETFTVTFNEATNNNVVDNRIAPASVVYADFVIDPNGSEVAIDYEFALGAIGVKDGSTGPAPSNLSVSKVCYVNTSTGADGATITEDETSHTYKGTIALADQNAALTSDEAVTVRVYVTWVDSNTPASNTNDTVVGKNAPILTMDITGTATQHVAE